MPLNDNAAISDSRAFVFYANVGAAAPTLANVNAFDPSNPDAFVGGASEVQVITLTGGPTGGTFTLSFGGQATAALAYNAAAAAIQTALQGLSSIGANNALVTGSAGGPWTVTFAGTMATQDVAQIVGNGVSLTGGTTPAVSVTTAVNGIVATVGGLTSAWSHLGHTDDDDDFNADEDGGDSSTRGTRQNPSLRETVEATTEYIEMNLVQLDRYSLNLYHGGGTYGSGYFDAPDSAGIVEYATLIIYADQGRRVAEYHPRTSVRRNGPAARERDGFLKFPIRLTPLKQAGQPVTRWLSNTLAA